MCLRFNPKQTGVAPHRTPAATGVSPLTPPIGTAWRPSAEASRIGQSPVRHIPISARPPSP